MLQWGTGRVLHYFSHMYLANFIPACVLSDFCQICVANSNKTECKKSERKVFLILTMTMIVAMSLVAANILFSWFNGPIRKNVLHTQRINNIKHPVSNTDKNFSVETNRIWQSANKTVNAIQPRQPWYPKAYNPYAPSGSTVSIYFRVIHNVSVNIIHGVTFSTRPS